MIAWEERAYKVLHHFIKKYTDGTDIPPDWVAGLISVECARLDPRAKRFEEHVYKSVTFVKQGNKSTAFPGFNSGRLRSFIVSTNNIDHLKSLATSYGYGQIMGYHYVNKWNLKPEQYMNLSIEDSVKWTVEFMKDGLRFVKFPELVKGTKTYSPYEQLLRWHNTGSTTGATYHPSYPTNAANVAVRYKKYMTMQEKLGNVSSPDVKF